MRAPDYPPQATQAGISGVVILEATIGIDGSVVDAKLLKSIPLLDAAAWNPCGNASSRPRT
jgi:protein TonB